MAERKMIQERVRYWGDFEGSLQGVIASLQAEIDQHGPDVRLVKERDYDYGGCYECGGSDAFFLIYERAETDVEMEKRLAKARKERERRKAEKAKLREEQEEKDRKEFARLSAKYLGKE